MRIAAAAFSLAGWVALIPHRSSQTPTARRAGDFGAGAGCAASAIVGLGQHRKLAADVGGLAAAAEAPTPTADSGRHGGGDTKPTPIVMPDGQKPPPATARQARIRRAPPPRRSRSFRSARRPQRRHPSTSATADPDRDSARLAPSPCAESGPRRYLTMAEASDVALAPIGSVRRTQVGREATEPMREDIRLLGAILGDTVREQNGEEVFDLVERARVESFRVRRSEIDRAELARHVRRHRHPSGHPRHPRVHPLRAAGQRRRGHPPRTPPGRARRGRRAAAEQQPGRHLSEARLRRAGFGDGCRRADRRAGVAGDHRASHRDAPPHRVRHPTPHHRADAAAHARPRPRPTTAATSNSSCAATS